MQNECRSELQHKKREKYTLSNCAVVDRETWLGAVDIVSTGCDGTSESVSLGGGDVVVVGSVRVLTETKLLLEGRVPVDARHIDWFADGWTKRIG